MGSGVLATIFAHITDYHIQLSIPISNRPLLHLPAPILSNSIKS